MKTNTISIQPLETGKEKVDFDLATKISLTELIEKEMTSIKEVQTFRKNLGAYI